MTWIFKWFQLFSSHDVSSLYRVLLLWHEYLNDSCHRSRTLYSDDTSWIENTWNHLNIQICLVHKLFMVTSPFHSSLAIFQQHQHMELIFHNSYVILGLVPSKVILCRVEMLTQKLPNKATLFLYHQQDFYPDYE
jgi:hypothetical protein